jgi:hypothetical protein
MTMPTITRLTTFTKLFILLLTVIATELGSNYGLYVAMTVWLFMDQVVRLEQTIIQTYVK